MTRPTRDARVVYTARGREVWVDNVDPRIWHAHRWGDATCLGFVETADPGFDALSVSGLWHAGDSVEELLDWLLDQYAYEESRP